jgi:hypothetical protein
MSSLDRNSVDRALERYLTKIILNKGQYNRATSAVSTVKKTIQSSQLCPNGATLYEQGSFSTRTTLKPRVDRDEAAEFDVDLAVETSRWDANDPKSALRIIYQILLDGGMSKERLKIKSFCVRINYTEGPSGEKFHLDVVPLLSHGGKIYAPKCKGTVEEWIQSDPGKLTRWFNSRANNEPTFRAQYLLLKRFAQANSIELPSIAIQKIASDSYLFKQVSNRYVRELLDMCRTIVALLGDPNYPLTNPVNSEENIRLRLKNGQLEKFRSCIVDAVKQIEQFSNNGTYADVANLFGYQFPSAESHEDERSLRTHGIYFDCDFSDRIDVSAVASEGSVNGSSYTLYVPASHENRIGANALDSITLRVDDFLKHHAVLWQIVNDPREVSFQVRGNFEDSSSVSTGIAERIESVSYAGNHFVRGFVVDGDRLKAITNKFRVNVLRAT